MIERSDVNCTNCGGRFIQELDMSLNGNHEIVCPLCGHYHYRVVQDDKVTEARWRSSSTPLQFSTPVYVATTTSFTFNTNFSFNTTNGTSTTLYTSWLNRSDLIIP